MTNFKTAALFTVFGFLLASLAGSLRAAPDQTLGMALMSARISSAGSILGGAGVVSVEHPSTGLYDVTFARSASGCVPVVSLESTVVAVEGFAQVRVLDFGSGPVRVRTFNTGTNPENLSFYLLVFCPK